MIGTIKNIFLNKGLVTGRVLTTGFKTMYWEKFPDHIVYYNANLITEKRGKIWWGDLDINFDGPKLIEIAKEINEDIYIVKDDKGHFENQEVNLEELKKISVWSTKIFN